ncbi:hypothetical protein GTF03_01510 [Roseobacter sp. HKCCD7415]|uniref:hypothetical protein n=1 Tax=unclassified Roseobacter TaxID=196798 RepID=UPI0011A7F889|nr:MULTISPECIES: hypothetical protein [unclassified Roseobacter]NNV47993.1 hypothetical protein [Roseobacter sp. HKCCD6265]NNV66882.1 hypothetical protein [Roseobacter sp. HKCCD8474]NNV83924.1 hypothetical protein [Roseobacter sp. HKCCD8414]NNW09467.1 hypothetical protein [Roseobacter sp. HKCCD8484]NNW39291.1 hypothetical protein [Roseobacter sp. HKCCD8654]NNW77660.1 hypothetical protein [Roseobacter sp. HKCCD8134]NNX33096.1 hypothetical protein [Roseobacter sp. HKCCD8418]NNX45800.1 hypothe
MTFEPLHIVPPGKEGTVFCLLCFWFHKKPETVQTVKLTLDHRIETLPARYTDVDPSNEPNRPHISSDTIDFKERETKQTEMRRNLFGAPRLYYLDFSLRLVALRPVWRPGQSPQRRR